MGYFLLLVDAGLIVAAAVRVLCHRGHNGAAGALRQSWGPKGGWLGRWFLKAQDSFWRPGEPAALQRAILHTAAWVERKERGAWCLGHRQVTWHRLTDVILQGCRRSPSEVSFIGLSGNNGRLGNPIPSHECVDPHGLEAHA